MERMNWLSRLASRGPGHRVPQGASLQTPVMADPETCLMVFKNHWSQVGNYAKVSSGLLSRPNFVFTVLNHSI